MTDTNVSFQAARSTFGQLGVVGGAIDATTAITNAIAAMLAQNIKKAELDNPAGYTISNTITQRFSQTIEGNEQVINCTGIAPGAGTPAWIVAYGNWSTNVDRFRMRKPVKDMLFQGNAAPTDGVWTANLYGLQCESYHMVIDGITVSGFDRGFTWAPTTGDTTGWLAWENKLDNCVATYNQYGWYGDFSSSSGASGAGMTAFQSVFGHNDYSLYNNLGEVTWIDVASDTPRLAHIKDNITGTGGGEFGFFHAQNCRFEAGGTTGTPWITNSGTMRLNNCFITERNVAGTTYNATADVIFTTNANGHTIVEGGDWRSSDGRYKATGAGSISQRGVRPLTDQLPVLFNAANSGILNNDFTAANGTNGWAVTTGAATLTNVADANMLLAGRALNITPTVSTVVSSAPIPLDTKYQDFNIAMLGANNNASTDVNWVVTQYNQTGNAVATGTAPVIPHGGAYTYLVYKGTVAADAAYAVITINFAAGQTSMVAVSDWYRTQW